MKNIKIIFFSLILFFASCEKVVDIDVPTIPPKLIIDASFEVFFDENPVIANTIVKLKLSADYFDETIPVVTNATVFLTNLSDNTIINFADVNLDGNYKPTSSFIPQDNIEYELTVIHNNQTYKGKATKVKSTVINYVNQGNRTLFTGDEIELKTSFTDDGAKENFYLFNFGFNNYVTIEDKFLNGSEYNFSYYIDMEKVALPSTLVVTLSGVTKEYYSYFRVLIDQSGQNAGGPFQSVPSSLLGNMINTTNENNFPLGYFHIGESDTFSIDLVKKN
ncbi:DUF4249 family protein [Polaribacter cellanae]|uniref:DUF4249 domain-containing protein n=1 Tax=Polaribacter cellanae TaxID=2818493 RepID=A0A975CQ65_9FLAO|nr:DUF4249 family protein [Polaribacter cellanae]QTE22685.1 DUF4249 domain-containing protein [Polaribacter cellanae]